MHSGSPAQARCGSEARPKSLILHLRTPGGSSRSSCGETAGECGPHRRQASKIFSSRFSRRHRVTRGPGARGLRRWRAARLRSPAMGSYRLRPCQQRRRCASLRASAHPHHPAHPCTPLHTPAHPCTPLHTPAHPCTPARPSQVDQAESDGLTLQRSTQERLLPGVCDFLHVRVSVRVWVRVRTSFFLLGVYVPSSREPTS
jgi:hypothetical protein